eukprot:TRINITY_DN7394_c0_g1_i2.p1 TRINITY_DN7394_c0_g1~~TRINITY_DN7394_c0_g1_i2.p1  ORF type:complete len:204 (-),score=42.95 TRINITY_DN7394_c0_g1_i2:15-626(-)
MRCCALFLKHALPTLKFPVEGGIPPVISAKQLDLHYNKHHNTYVTNLNNLVGADSSLEGKTVEELIFLARDDPQKKGLFNNAAQHFNHSFYWKCLTPNGSSMPDSMKEALSKSFGSVEAFQSEFSKSALANFGSGWTWLASQDGKLVIVNTSNAEVALKDGLKPILTCDVWEHAYYVDFLNRRDSYLESFWKIVDWEAVSANL